VSEQSAVSQPDDVVDEVVEKVTHSPITSVLAIILAVVGGALMGWSFLTGIAEAIRTPHPDSIWIALFFIGAGLDIVAIVLALVGIIRRAHRVLSIVAVVLALVPGLIVLVIAALRFL
jgi:predicted MFS family arabinose efflux permease